MTDAEQQRVEEAAREVVSGGVDDASIIRATRLMLAATAPGQSPGDVVEAFFSLPAAVAVVVGVGPDEAAEYLRAAMRRIAEVVAREGAPS